MVEIQEGRVGELSEYASVDTAFQVTSVLDPTLPEGGLGGIHLVERALRKPYTKDYDVENPPAAWPARFDMSAWGCLVARQDDARVGGALVAFDTQGLEMLEGRTDLAVLWDLRVEPKARGRGVGTALFRAASRWAVQRRCTVLKVETQNVNVPACRFYARQGCTLGGIHRFAYPELPEEIQLLWYRDLVEVAGQ